MKCELNMYAHVNLVGEVSTKKKLLHYQTLNNSLNIPTIPFANKIMQLAIIGQNRQISKKKSNT